MGSHRHPAHGRWTKPERMPLICSRRPRRSLGVSHGGLGCALVAPGGISPKADQRRGQGWPKAHQGQAFGKMEALFGRMHPQPLKGVHGAAAGVNQCAAHADLRRAGGRAGGTDGQFWDNWGVTACLASSDQPSPQSSQSAPAMTAELARTRPRHP